MDFYRFSISWSRVLPDADPSVPNEDGLRYYDNLINELLHNNIEPQITMYYWDFPQHLVKFERNVELLNWHFLKYAEILFERYSDRVKTWVTLNDPLAICNYGYLEPAGVGNYQCAHDMLVLHAKVYALYHSKYAGSDGRLGIALNCSYAFPAVPDDPQQQAASDRAMQFTVSKRIVNCIYIVNISQDLFFSF